MKKEWQMQGREGRGERDGRGLRREMEEKRTVAKIGMTVSLGVLVATGMMRGRGAKVLHIWSGLALIGFSVWHHRLYRAPNRNHPE